MPFVVAVTLLGGAVGAAAARALGRYPYRRPEETGPAPMPRWLVAALVAATWGLLARAVGARPELLAYLVVAALVVALTWTDLDVHRLPERLTLPAYPVLLALLAIAAGVQGDWRALGRAVIAGAALYAGYLLIAVVSAGAIGLGDVTLVGLLGLATGYRGWQAVLLGQFFAYLLAGVVTLGLLVARRAGRRSRIAFGPWLGAGAVLALLVG